MFHVYGGAELAIVKLVEYLKGKDHTVDLLTMITMPEVKEDLKTDNIFYANTYQELAQLLGGLTLNYDVINYHNHPAEVLFPSPYPSVWFMNEPPEEALCGQPLNPTDVKHVHDNITKIAVSDVYNKVRVRKLYDRDDAVVIPYGVDYDYFSKGKANRWYFDNKNKFTILQAAWIHPRKNQLETLRIFNEVLKFVPNARLILCGSITVPYINELIKYIEDNKLTDNVTIDGTFGDRNYLRNLYHSVDLLLQPITDQGGWISPLEAICAGLPVVASNNAVFASYFRKHKLATVTDNYIEAIMDIYKHNRKYKKINKVAKEYIKANLTWEKYASEVEKLLKSAK